MVRIGTCALGTRPRIVAVVDEFLDTELLMRFRGQADILEMRVDCYREPPDRVVGYLDEVRSRVGLPMIGTVRENDFTEHDRPAFFRAIMPFVDCIDIELAAPVSDEVLSCAAGKTIIVSEHDFSATPDDAALGSIVERAVRQGADIVKIATMAKSRADVVRLLRFTETCTVPVVTIAMSAIGTVSRVIAPLFGSLFTYGYITRPVAPGQLPVERLSEMRELFFPQE